MSGDDYPYRSPEGAKTWTPEWPPTAPGTRQTTAANPAFAESAATGAFRAPSLTMIVWAALVLFIPGNALIIPVGEEVNPPSPWTFFVLAIGGSIGAQAALITVLVVWAAGPFWLRLAWHWAAAAMLLLAWLLGELWVFGDKVFQPYGIQWYESKQFACGLLLCSLLVQAVPWLLRIYLGWRIQLLGATPGSIAERLSIRDLLCGTVLAALAVAAARVGRPEVTANGEYWLGWLGWLGICIGAAMFALVAIVPMVYFTLGMRSAGWGIVGVVTLSVIVATGLTGLLLATRPVGGPPIWWIPLAMIALVSGYSGGLAGTLFAARSFGYRLARGR